MFTLVTLHQPSFVCCTNLVLCYTFYMDTPTMTPVMIQAAQQIWSDFRGYYQHRPKPGITWPEVVSSISKGETGMGDYCDDNLFYAEVLTQWKLIPDECPDINDAASIDIWNAVVTYVHNECWKAEGTPHHA